MASLRQPDLFGGSGLVERRVFDLPDADLTLWEQFFERAEADRLYEALLRETGWQQDAMTMYGNSVNLPRLTSWYGDCDRAYSYSTIVMNPHPWTPDLQAIRERVETETGTAFNSVLLNLYRDGRDSVGWHSDDEPELGHNPVIASVSLGEQRTFQLRHCTRRELPRVDVALGHGSLLLMAGATQRCWKHQIPKTAKPVGPRINLTFRVIH